MGSVPTTYDATVTVNVDGSLAGASASSGVTQVALVSGSTVGSAVNWTGSALTFSGLTIGDSYDKVRVYTNHGNGSATYYDIALPTAISSTNTSATVNLYKLTRGALPTGVASATVGGKTDYVLAPSGTAVQLVASPSTNYAITGWSRTSGTTGTLASTTAATTTFTMGTGPATVTPAAASTVYNATVNVKVNGGNPSTTDNIAGVQLYSGSTAGPSVTSGTNGVFTFNSLSNINSYDKVRITTTKANGTSATYVDVALATALSKDNTSEDANLYRIKLGSLPNGVSGTTVGGKVTGTNDYVLVPAGGKVTLTTSVDTANGYTFNQWEATGGSTITSATNPSTDLTAKSNTVDEVVRPTVNTHPILSITGNDTVQVETGYDPSATTLTLKAKNTGPGASSNIVYKITATSVDAAHVASAAADSNTFTVAPTGGSLSAVSGEQTLTLTAKSRAVGTYKVRVWAYDSADTTVAPAYKDVTLEVARAGTPTFNPASLTWDTYTRALTGGGTSFSTEANLTNTYRDYTSLVLTFNGNTLTQGTDYTVSHTASADKATVTLTNAFLSKLTAADNNKTVRATFTNANDLTASADITVNVTDTMPSITKVTTNTGVVVGNAVNVTGITTSNSSTPAAGTVTYAWYRNGTEISGATGSSIPTTGYDAGDTIRVVVTGTGVPGAAKPSGHDVYTGSAENTIVLQRRTWTVTANLSVDGAAAVTTHADLTVSASPTSVLEGNSSNLSTGVKTGVYGYKFTGWTVSTSDTVANAAALNTSIVPTGNVTVTANYKTVTDLTATPGSVSGQGEFGESGSWPALSQVTVNNRGKRNATATYQLYSDAGCTTAMTGSSAPFTLASSGNVNAGGSATLTVTPRSDLSQGMYSAWLKVTETTANPGDNTVNGEAFEAVIPITFTVTAPTKFTGTVVLKLDTATTTTPTVTLRNGNNTPVNLTASGGKYSTAAKALNTSLVYQVYVNGTRTNATVAAAAPDATVQFWSVTTNVNPSGAGSVSAGGTRYTIDGKTAYEDGAMASLTASAGTGYRFTSWTGVPSGVTATDNPVAIPISAATTVTANFEQTYGIRYYRNETSSDSQILSTDSGPYTSATTGITLAGAPTRAGYVFRGWHTARTGNPTFTAGQTGVSASALGSVSGGYYSLYAIWQQAALTWDTDTTLEKGEYSKSYYDSISGATSSDNTAITYAEVGTALSAIGLTLRSDGSVTGRPTNTGTFTFQAKATSDSGVTATKSFSITVDKTTPTLVVSGIGSVTAGGALNAATLTATAVADYWNGTAWVDFDDKFTDATPGSTTGTSRGGTLALAAKTGGATSFPSDGTSLACTVTYTPSTANQKFYNTATADITATPGQVVKALTVTPGYHNFGTGTFGSYTAPSKTDFQVTNGGTAATGAIQYKFENVTSPGGGSVNAFAVSGLTTGTLNPNGASGDSDTFTVSVNSTSLAVGTYEADLVVYYTDAADGDITATSHLRFEVVQPTEFDATVTTRVTTNAAAASARNIGGVQLLPLGGGTALAGTGTGGVYRFATKPSYGEVYLVQVKYESSDSWLNVTDAGGAAMTISAASPSKTVDFYELAVTSTPVDVAASGASLNADGDTIGYFLAGQAISVAANAVNNHRYNNWTQKNNDSVSTSLGFAYTMPARAETLTANYTRNSDTYNVYYAGGGAPASAALPVDNTDYNTGASVTVKEMQGVWPGHTFAGWSYNGTTYNANQTVTMGSANITFTAQWTENTATWGTLGGATYGSDYTASVAPTNAGLGITGYALKSGSSLPGGLTLNNATGTISGKPYASAGDYKFTVVATSTVGGVSTSWEHEYTLTVNKARPTITGVTITGGTTGGALSAATVKATVAAPYYNGSAWSDPTRSVELTLQGGATSGTPAIGDLAMTKQGGGTNFDATTNVTVAYTPSGTTGTQSGVTGQTYGDIYQGASIDTVASFGGLSYNIGLDKNNASFTVTKGLTDYNPANADITVTNNSTSSTEANLSYALIGADAGKFTLSTDHADNVPAGGTASFTVTPNFNTTAGTYVAQVKVDNKDGSDIKATEYVTLVLTVTDPATFTATVNVFETAVGAGSHSPKAIAGVRLMNAAGDTVTASSSTPTGVYTFNDAAYSASYNIQVQYAGGDDWVTVPGKSVRQSSPSADVDFYQIKLDQNPNVGATPYLNDGTSDEGYFVSGTSVVASTDVPAGNTFTGWKEGATVHSTSTSYTHSVTAPATLTATFNAPITALDVNVAKPAADGTPATAGGVTVSGIVPGDAGVTVTNITWTPRPAGTGNTFIGGQDYTATISLRPNGSREFATAGGSWTAAGPTADGAQLSVVSVTADLLVLQLYYAAEVKINSVGISTSDPVAKASSTTVAPSSSTYQVSKVEWTDNAGGAAVSSTNPFAPGHNYKITVTLVPSDSKYAFDPASIQTAGNATVSSPVVGTQNATVESASATEVVLSYTPFEVAEKTVVGISAEGSVDTVFYAQTATHTANTATGHKSGVGFVWNPDKSAITVKERYGDNTDSPVAAANWKFVYGDTPAAAKDHDMPAAGHTFTQSEIATYHGKNVYVQSGSNVAEAAVGSIILQVLVAREISTNRRWTSNELTIANGAAFTAPSDITATTRFNAYVPALREDVDGMTYSDTKSPTSKNYHYEVQLNSGYQQVTTGTSMDQATYNGKDLYVCFTDINNNTVRTYVGTLNIPSDTPATNANVQVEKVLEPGTPATTAQPGEILTAVVTGITGAPSYQWQIENGGTWSNITGQTGTNYTPTTGDSGKKVRVVVREAGTTGEAVSNEVTIGNQLVNNIELTTEKIPAKGDTPPSVNDFGKLNSGDPYQVDTTKSVVWEYKDGATWKSMPAGPFQPNTEYRVTVPVKLNENTGYGDNPTGGLTTDDGTRRGGTVDKNNSTLTVSFPATAAENSVSHVDVFFDNIPVYGESIPGSPTNVTDPRETIAGERDATDFTATWYENFVDVNNTGAPKTGTFDVGKNYTVVVKVRPSTGYEYTSSTSFNFHFGTYRSEEVTPAVSGGVYTMYYTFPDATKYPASAATITLQNQDHANSDTQYGDTLKALVGGTANTDLGYQWQRSADGATFTDISGATGVTYVAGKSDVGNHIRVKLTKDGTNDVSATAPSESVLVEKRLLSATYSAASKMWDGTTDATVTNTGLTGVLSGDTVSLTGESGAFADANVGTNKDVTVTAGLTGADAAYYELAPIGAPKASITSLRVVWSDLAFTVDQSKEYDGTTTVKAAGADLSGTQSIGGGAVDWSDTCSLTDAQKTAVAAALTFGFAYNHENATRSATDPADRIVVTPNAASAAGIDLSVFAGTRELPGTITPKQIAVSKSDSLSGASIPNGGNPVVTLTGSVTYGDGRLVKNGDSPLTFKVQAGFADNHTPGAQTVTISGVSAGTSDGLTWTDRNYQLVWDGDTSTTGTVSGGELTGLNVQNGGSAVYGNTYDSVTGLLINAVYDNGATTVPLTSFTDLKNLGYLALIQDNKTGSAEYYFATDADQIVGWTGAGTSAQLPFRLVKDEGSPTADATTWAANASSAGTINVSPRPLNVSVAGAAGADITKEYDGNTNVTATIDYTITSGLVDGSYSDSGKVTASGSPAYVNKEAGTSKTITVSGITLSGSSASRYTVNAIATTEGDITPKPISVNFGAAPEVQVGSSGQVTLTHTVTAADGLVTGDTSFTVMATGQYDDTSTVGTGVPVSISGLVWNNANYAVTAGNTDGKTTGNVTDKTIGAVSVTYADPKAGDSPADALGYVNSNQVNAPVTHWYKVDSATDWSNTANEVAIGTGSFDADGFYMVTATFTPQAGWSFDQSAAGTQFMVNGSVRTLNSTLIYNADGSATVKYIFTLTSDKTITRVDASVTAPVFGNTPATSANLTLAQNAGGEDLSSHVRLGTVSWSPAHDPFNASTVYTATFTVEAIGGYHFASGANVVRFVMNSVGPIPGAGSANRDDVSVVTRGSGDSYTVEITFPATGSAGATPEVDVVTPVKGNHTADATSSDVTVVRTVWTDRNGNTLSASDVYAAGGRYTAKVTIEPILGNVKAGDRILVGGERREVMTDTDGSLYVERTYNIDPVTPKVTLTEPSKGATPANAWTSDTRNVTVDGTEWVVGSSEGGEAMSGTFEAGSTYTAIIRISGTPESPIQVGGTVQLNNRDHQVKSDGTGLYITHTYSIPDDTPAPPGPSIVESKPLVTYVVGDKGTTPDPTAEQVSSGGKPKEVPKVTGLGENEFKGWSLDDPSKVEEPTLVDPTTVTIRSDTTFYAVYGPIEHDVKIHDWYVKGYPDGRFRPDGSITRAEAATIIARACLPGFVEGTDYGDVGYSDIAGHWAESAIAFCTITGVMNGYDDGTFKADKRITRQEFTVAFGRMAGLVESQGMPFTDADMIAPWAEDGIYTCLINGWIEGYPDGTFLPNNYIRRSEAVKVVNGYLNRGVTSEGVAHLEEGDYVTYSDVDIYHWAYYYIMEASNGHDFYYIDEENKVAPEQWTDADKINYWTPEG